MSERPPVRNNFLDFKDARGDMLHFDVTLAVLQVFDGEVR